jgi:hypothetical protein
MKHRIKILLGEILRESFLNEAEDTAHLLDRVRKRVESMTDDDLNPQVKQRILTNLETVRNTDFPTNRSYGILLGEFLPKPTSSLYVDVGGRGYYRIVEFGVDSTGDQIWLVVRNNKVPTLMLRKRIQSADLNHLKNKLDVDVVVRNIEKFDPNQQVGSGESKHKVRR